MPLLFDGGLILLKFQDLRDSVFKLLPPKLFLQSNKQNMPAAWAEWALAKQHFECVTKFSI